MKKVNVQRLAAAQPKTVGSRVWWEIQGLNELRLDPGWGSKQPGSGVAIDWVTGRSCSSAIEAGRRLNVQSGLRKGWAASWFELSRP